VIAAGCALTAGALFLMTALRVPLERLSDETSQIAGPGGHVHPPASEADLLRYYAPVLRLDSDERWIAVDGWTMPGARG